MVYRVCKVIWSNTKFILRTNKIGICHQLYSLKFHISFVPRYFDDFFLKQNDYLSDLCFRFKLLFLIINYFGSHLSICFTRLQLRPSVCDKNASFHLIQVQPSIRRIRLQFQAYKLLLFVVFLLPLKLNQCMEFF
jgi:hypothetical protein